MVNNFQREGSVSNAHVGREFELEAQNYFKHKRSVELRRPYRVPVGLSATDRKDREFDLGSSEPPILVECKSHTWTKSGNVPSAKITVWNEAMFFFSLAPEKYSKVLFVLRHFNDKRGETLAEYYVRNHGHLIPDGVEVLEYDGEEVNQVWPRQ
ncbi:MAG: hypothetical protein F4X20_03050 [Dehalococcoidia bacterium]|nr:hypothetical protein [Dehalococcoidia bacterium]